MAGPTVIVFGPTGACGSAAARTASELGAKVILAMRNVDKAIPGLSAEQEKKESGRFERVTADLTQPETVGEAVRRSGAKHAFIYAAHGSQDHMRATIEALKAAGITLVVFLSSYTVRTKHGDRQALAAVEPSEVIPYLHVQVELNLFDVFGADGFVAARPGFFASNVTGFKSMVEAGSVRVQAPDALVDCIAPEDIGRVCGTVLANGTPSDGNRAIYLFGPRLIPQREMLQTFAKALGKDPSYSSMDEDQALKFHTEERGYPMPVAKYVVARSTASENFGPGNVFGYPVSDEELRNVEKYSGKKGMTFEQWVEQNKPSWT